MPEENLPEMYDADRAMSEFLIYQTENGEPRVQVRFVPAICIADPEAHRGFV
jgi:hypothetical protein